MDTPATGSAAPSRSSLSLTYLILAGVAVIAVLFAFSGSNVMPNNWYALFKAVHVVFAAFWVGGGLTLTILAIRAQLANDGPGIVSIAQQAGFIGERFYAPAGLITFLMGIAMMINSSWGWGHFWIVFGLIGYAATFLVGLLVLSPLTKKVAASAQEKGPLHADTLALIDRVMLIARFDVAVLLLVVLDMVVKPFA